MLDRHRSWRPAYHAGLLRQNAIGQKFLLSLRCYEKKNENVSRRLHGWRDRKLTRTRGRRFATAD